MENNENFTSDDWEKFKKNQKRIMKVNDKKIKNQRKRY